MPIFRRDHDEAAADARHRLGLLVAVAAHVERNTPQVFPQATTDRLEDAADELLTGSGPLSFETRKVVERIAQSLNIRNPGRPWGTALLAALADIDDEP